MAADDGMMPQTLEALAHARAAGSSPEGTQSTAHRCKALSKLLVKSGFFFLRCCTTQCDAMRCNVVFHSFFAPGRLSCPICRNPLLNLKVLPKPALVSLSSRSSVMWSRQPSPNVSCFGPLSRSIAAAHCAAGYGCLRLRPCASSALLAHPLHAMSTTQCCLSYQAPPCAAA